MKNINWENVEFKDEKRFLSNMYPCKVKIFGKEYQSSENFYMSMKFDGVDDELCEVLRTCTPLESKKIANKNAGRIRQDWDMCKVLIMSFGVLAKFIQNKDIREKLLLTQGEHLEERNDWGDTFWGTCNGKGKNNLGKILMEVRKKFIEELYGEGYEGPYPRPECNCDGWGCFGCLNTHQEIRSSQGIFS